MCGISVVLAPGGDREGAQRLRRMHAPIRHRGPDGEGFLALDTAGHVTRADRADAIPGGALQLGFAFRRLRILDLSDAAAQPMASPDGSAWIVFNGEVYNFRGLRAELEAGGRRFRSRGDTEVVLAAYEAWGEECFGRLEGMWAVAIADLRRRRLVLSRDRFGIKPLYWALHQGRLLAGSEIRQVLAARGERPEPREPLVHMFLRGSRSPCLEETFFEGVRAVPPATTCVLPFDGPLEAPVFRMYWDLARFNARGPALPYEEARARFAATLHDAVRSHAVADVAVGTLLSGGLDSAAVAALLAPAAREAGRSCPAFTFGVAGAEPSELPFAEAMAREHGLPHHVAGLDAAWVGAHAATVVRTLEEPPLALPALAQYRVFQLCREHDTTVVLDGQGADEILGGYPYHQRLLLADRLRRGRLGAFAAELRAIGRWERTGTARLLGGLVLPPLRARLRSAPAWLSGDYGGRDGGGAELRAARADRGLDAAALNRQLYSEVKWGNVKIVLAYADKNAMAHSVEARVPYFDRRLVELAFALPDEYKVGAGQRKRILRDAARGLVPPAIVERADRMGFGLPEPALMRALWPEVRRTLGETRLLGAPCFRRPQAEALVRRYEGGQDHDARTVWRLHALALWAREFDVQLG
jgi:asparagine synthase (glutamine-hydrolysing)